MTRYLIRRLLGAIPLVLGVATVVFFVIHLAPGDPTNLLLAPGADEAVIEQTRANFGLDDPLPLRYAKWIGALARGDLGYSYSHGRPVTSVIGEMLPNTLLLSGLALAVAFVVGIAIGVVQAVRPYSLPDSILSVVALFFYSMPSFWLALMLILVFSYFARNLWEWPIWFPASGIRSPDFDLMGPGERTLDRLRHLVLPVTTLALVVAAGVARFTRGSLLEVVGQDYIRTARAKGLPERTVILHHALRNALIPVITLLGLYLPVLFSGTVFIETVFAWPGMGKTIVDAIGTRDYPLVMASSLIFAAMVVLGNLVADLLYAVVDPRIRHE
ncbi:MAG: ABC transporter permease [Longimicrobiales bacterium]|nr:ABC transporter permease [Longimicrobiales bacterium]